MSEQALYCPHCGQPVRAADQYCTTCGEQLTNAPADVYAVTWPTHDEEPGAANSPDIVPLRYVKPDKPLRYRIRRALRHRKPAPGT